MGKVVKKPQLAKVLKTSVGSKEAVKFSYYEFFKWLSIGFVVSSVGIAIALGLAIISGKRFF